MTSPSTGNESWPLGPDAETLSVLQGGALQVALPAVYAIAAAVGVPGNVLSLWVLCRHVGARSPSAIFLMNLSLTDALLGAVLPFQIHYHRNRNHWAWGAGLCGAVTIGFYANMYVSAITVACIGVDRLVGVARPLAHARWRRRRRYAVGACAASWAVVLAALSPLAAADLTYDVTALGVVTCFDVLRWDMLPGPAAWAGFLFGAIALLFLLPFAVTVGAYVSTIRVLLRAPPADATRWDASRSASVVAGVRADVVGAEQAPLSPMSATSGFPATNSCSGRMDTSSTKMLTPSSPALTSTSCSENTAVSGSISTSCSGGSASSGILTTPASAQMTSAAPCDPVGGHSTSTSGVWASTSGSVEAATSCSAQMSPVASASMSRTQEPSGFPLSSTSGLRARTCGYGPRRRAVCLAAVVLAAFVLCFAPSHVTLLLHVVGRLFLGRGCYAAYKMALALGCLSCVLDPAVYYLASRDFRARVRGFLPWTRPAAREHVHRHRGDGRETAL